MDNFIVYTSNVDDDYNSVYCTNCKSCGEWGCECWGGCSMLYCKYGPGLIEEYERMKKDINLLLEMLEELGIENPYEIDLARVKKISKYYIKQICYSIKDVIACEFENIKDIREED